MGRDSQSDKIENGYMDIHDQEDYVTPKNKPASPYTSPAAVAILVIGIGMAFGMNSGYALNPARDFGPRVFSACAGWGSKVFTLRDHYFWIPIVAPLIGGAIGGATYMGLVEIHHPQN
uniref:Aquaporin n=1 Tax=Globisporangium ultimum (strain ATCC 200006 / CBS 805.95 / DAOM BR144) TaxID=431595 RepID=K3W8E1_GLOUD